MRVAPRKNCSTERACGPHCWIGWVQNREQSMRTHRGRAMNRRLPSLSMLRTFEATARLGSFTRAADQLNMTQGAVSYQVRMLEEHLGIKLFLRTPRKLVLTLDGDKLAHSLIRAFGALATALDEVCPSLSKDRLSVTVFTSFATKWLVPRLRGFHQTHPQINLRILGEDKPVDPSEFDHDVGIR